MTQIHTLVLLQQNTEGNYKRRMVFEHGSVGFMTANNYGFAAAVYSGFACVFPTRSIHLTLCCIPNNPTMLPPCSDTRLKDKEALSSATTLHQESEVCWGMIQPLLCGLCA